MNIKPISMKLTKPDFSSTNEFLSDSTEYNAQQFDLIDDTLTVRENEEFFINCVVDSSKPAAQIVFSTASSNDNNNNNIIAMQNVSSNDHLSSKSFSGLSSSSSSSSSSLSSLLERSLKASTKSLASLVSTNSNVFKNNDRTFKTVYSARLKANLKDHGKVITCKADNGFSNQKWENKKVLNVLCRKFYF
jgi:hypothetical protein